MLGEKVEEFIKRKAASVCSNIEYFMAAIMAATLFVVSFKFQVNNGTHSMPLNNYTVFVGPPTTGKSIAIKKTCVHEPLAEHS